MTITQAKYYIMESANEGYLDFRDVDELLKKTDEEIIKFAEERGERGDYEAQEAIYNNALEAEVTGN